jgi:hypothetical protein
MVAVKEVAQEFALDEKELIRQGLRAFLLERLRLLDAERRAKCAKFGVTTSSWNPTASLATAPACRHCLSKLPVLPKVRSMS